MTQITIGLDVSKDGLDVHRLSDGANRRFSNSPSGFRTLIGWIGANVSRVVFEPTGPYHRGIERALAESGVPMVKINPRQARRFAEATGQVAKTDRLDARLLAKMGEMLQLDPRPAPPEAIVELRQLRLSRQSLVKDQTAALNRQKSLTVLLLKRQNAQRLKQIETQIAAIDAEISRRVQADADFAARLEILTSIPGIGLQSALGLLIEMPELGSLEPGQAASLAGLAPIVRQSGRWTGKAFIRGGRPAARRMLYMPALVAVRFNPNFKAKYEQLTGAGKPAKVAIIAVMRKFVVLANALLKAQRTWAPQMP